MAGDLHTHSTCSDGSVPIHRLPLMAARLGLSALALSDHDTILSAQYAYDHPVQDGVRLIPAAELTGYDFERSHRVHLLTFWPDLDCPALRRHCDIMRQRRNECALQSCREIEALYPQFRTEQALEYAQDSGVLFKSGIMQALQQLGLCDGIYTGLYHELFGWEPRGKCLHSPAYPPVREVLATARASGAVVVFAHPTVYKSMPLVRELVAEEAIDGIEVDHPQQPRGQGRVRRPLRGPRPHRHRRQRLPRREPRQAPPGGCLRHRGRPDRAYRGTGPQAPGRRSVTGSH